MKIEGFHRLPCELIAFLLQALLIIVRCAFPVALTVARFGPLCHWLRKRLSRADLVVQRQWTVLKAKEKMSGREVFEPCDFQ